MHFAVESAFVLCVKFVNYFVCVSFVLVCFGRFEVGVLGFFFCIESGLSQTKYHVTSRCSITPALCAYVGQFLSCSFVVLLRKSLPQNYNLKTAAELGVTCVRSLLFRVLKVFVLRFALFFARFKSRKKKMLVKYEVIFVRGLWNIVRFG